MQFSGAVVSVNKVLQNLQYESNDEWAGNDTLSIIVDDSRGKTNFSVTLVIKPVNDPPTIVAPSEMNTVEKVWITLGQSISVEDKDAGDGAIAVLCVASLGKLDLTHTDKTLMIDLIL